MSSKVKSLAVVVSALALSACGGPSEQGSPTMNPGENCFSCHTASGQAREETFSAAGTVFAKLSSKTTEGVSGATVTITDANGLAHTFTTNAAGNFYAKVNLPGPLKKAAIDYNGKHLEMSTTPTGACNSCHTDPPLNGAPGRLYVP